MQIHLDFLMGKSKTVQFEEDVEVNDINKDTSPDFDYVPLSESENYYGGAEDGADYDDDPKNVNWKRIKLMKLAMNLFVKPENLFRVR